MNREGQIAQGPAALMPHAVVALWNGSASTCDGGGSMNRSEFSMNASDRVSGVLHRGGRDQRRTQLGGLPQRWRAPAAYVDSLGIQD